MEVTEIPRENKQLILTANKAVRKALQQGSSLPSKEKWSTSPTSKKGKQSTTSILRLIQIQPFMQNIPSKLNLQHWLQQTRRAGSAALHKASLQSYLSANAPFEFPNNTSQKLDLQLWESSQNTSQNIFSHEDTKNPQ